MRGFITGLARALIFFRDSSGYAIGQQSSLSNGATSGAYVADDPITAGYNPAPAVNVDVTGGDKIITTVQYGNAKVPPFDLAIAGLDTVLLALITGASINTANSFHTYMADNSNLTSPRTLALALQSRYTLDTGDPYWITTIFPAVQMRLKRGPQAYQAKSDVILSCTPLMATTAHDGRGFGTSGLNLNLEGDKTDHYDLISAHPIHILTFKADAIATTFNSIYKPISTVVTNNATPNQMVKNGTPTALSAVTLAGLNTLAAAGTAADVHVLTQQSDYVPV